LRKEHAVRRHFGAAEIVQPIKTLPFVSTEVHPKIVVDILSQEECSTHRQCLSLHPPRIYRTQTPSTAGDSFRCSVVITAKERKLLIGSMIDTDTSRVQG